MKGRRPSRKLVGEFAETKYRTRSECERAASETFPRAKMRFGQSDIMESRKQPSHEEISELELSYFELQAYWGVTKHMGGMKATRELVELCRIDEAKYVLEVGCGAGITPCYIAKRYGCRVVGVDVSQRMIDRSKERARKERVEDRVRFRVADAQNLPFEEGFFDAVIGEFVTMFPEDKQRAVSEYVRVTKPGGYVGLNEGTWVKTPPPTELVEYLSRATGARLETSDGWKELLEASGLREIGVRTYRVNMLKEWIGEIRRWDLRDYLGAWYRFLSLYTASPAFRRVIREKYLHGLSLRASLGFLEYMGYGIYVGRK